MSLFRREEPLHERLAREGGLVQREPRAPGRRLRRPEEETPIHSAAPPRSEVGIHGIPQIREWDATQTVEAPGIDGDAAAFVVLPDGSILVEDGPDTSLQPLADAVERELQPPYRARAARQKGDLWAVQARRIQVLQLRNAPDRDALELTRDGLLVDGERAFGSAPELEGLGDVVRAERLDGDLWEVRASRL